MILVGVSRTSKRADLPPKRGVKAANGRWCTVSRPEALFSYKHALIVGLTEDRRPGRIRKNRMRLRTASDPERYPD